MRSGFLFPHNKPDGGSAMAATFTRPKCGAVGSVKKEIPRGATIRCRHCQTRFSPLPSEERVSHVEVPESKVEDFLAHISDPLAQIGSARPSSVVEPPPIPITSAKPASLLSHKRTVLLLATSGALLLGLGCIGAIFLLRGLDTSVKPQKATEQLTKKNDPIDPVSAFKKV